MVDMAKSSTEPVLSSRTFRVHTGSSLVQRIGSKAFPVRGDVDLPRDLKQEIAKLKQKRSEFFYNKNRDYRAVEREELALFRSILDHEIERRKKRICDPDQPHCKPLALFKTDCV